MQRQKLLKWSHVLALYLFWPALLLVVWGELKPQPPWLEAHVWDKLLHLAAYFGLAALAGLALGTRKKVVWAVVILIALGGALEVVQGFTGRDTSFYDGLANALGAMSGGCAGWLLLRAMRPKA